MSKSILVSSHLDYERQFFNRTLSPDFQVTQSDGGDEAIDYMEHHPVDLLLLEESMPEVDGFETLRIVRDEKNGWPQTPVIFIHGSIESVLKAWSLGAADCLSRPFNSVMVLSLVKRNLHSTRVVGNP